MGILNDKTSLNPNWVLSSQKGESWQSDIKMIYKQSTGN